MAEWVWRQRGPRPAVGRGSGSSCHPDRRRSAAPLVRHKLVVARNRWFESVFLQQRVSELSVLRTGGRGQEGGHEAVPRDLAHRGQHAIVEGRLAQLLARKLD